MDRNEQNNRIKEAIHIAKQGDLPRAREMITEIVDHDPENDQALLAYAFIAPNKLEAEQVLEEVLRINPNNITALKQLAKLRNDPSFTPPTETTTVSPFTEMPSQTPAFEPGTYLDEQTTPKEPVLEETETSKVGIFQETAPESLPCIQCGKPTTSNSNYCEDCKREINHKRQAIESPLGGMTAMELEKKVDQLIAIQEEQQQELRKISRAAQLYFWLTIIGFVLSLGYVCIMVFGLTSLIGGSSGFNFPTQ